MDFRIKRRELIDNLLLKMEEVFQENMLIMNEISKSVDDANDYRKASQETGGLFLDP